MKNKGSNFGSKREPNPARGKKLHIDIQPEMPDHVKNTKTKQNSQRKGALRLEPCHCDNMRMPPWLTGKKCTWCCVRLLRAQRADKERDGGRLAAGAA